jgi:hypothetical protein
MDMNKLRWIFGVAHVAIWIAFVLAVEAAMADSPSRVGYAVLCAWWATLYAGQLLGTTWRAVAIFLTGMIVVLAIDASFGWQLLYHDPPSVVSTAFVKVSSILCVLWGSPFVVNEFVRRLRDRISK